MSFEKFSILTCAFRLACQPHRSNHHKNGKDNQRAQSEQNGIAFEGNLISDIFLCLCCSCISRLLLQLVRFSYDFHSCECGIGDPYVLFSFKLVSSSVFCCCYWWWWWWGAPTWDLKTHTTFIYKHTSQTESR